MKAVFAGRFERLRHEQRGEVSSTLIFFSVVIFALFLSFHGALIYHGRQVVAAAAQDGLRAAQLDGATEELGVQSAQATLDLANNLDETAIAIDRGDDTVSVVVSAKVRTPFLPLFDDITFELEGPVEQFVSQADRQ